MNTGAISTNTRISSHYVSITSKHNKSLNLHYATCGVGEPILLLHGWPTSSHLWRNVMPKLGETHKVIALDLPGFGNSDKPLDIRYSFTFYEEVIDAFISMLELPSTGLVVHDLGGPVGLMWALNHPEKVNALAMLNTLVYPEMSWAVKLFMLATHLPGVKKWLGSAAGLKAAIKFGVYHSKRLTLADILPYQTPFQSIKAQQALMRSAQGLSLRGFKQLGRDITTFKKPVCLIYGEKDKILPDIAKTMSRLHKDLPHAKLTSLPECGHFLQEDKPEELGQLLASFFNEK